jgi:hypothetical protein
MGISDRELKAGLPSPGPRPALSVANALLKSTFRASHLDTRRLYTTAAASLFSSSSYSL